MCAVYELDLIAALVGHSVEVFLITWYNGNDIAFPNQTHETDLVLYLLQRRANLRPDVIGGLWISLYSFHGQPVSFNDSDLHVTGSLCIPRMGKLGRLLDSDDSRKSFNLEMSPWKESPGHPHRLFSGLICKDPLYPPITLHLGHAYFQGCVCLCWFLRYNVPTAQWATRGFGSVNLVTNLPQGMKICQPSNSAMPYFTEADMCRGPGVWVPGTLNARKLASSLWTSKCVWLMASPLFGPFIDSHKPGAKCWRGVKG